MNTDITEMLKDDEVPYNEWMSKYPNGTLLTSMNIPGSFNSLATVPDSLYKDFDGVDLLFRT
jgi:hypothetical protein